MKAHFYKYANQSVNEKSFDNGNGTEEIRIVFMFLSCASICRKNTLIFSYSNSNASANEPD